jgi:hypothetical protein
MEGTMSLATLHDRVRNLGLGLMFEQHWGRGFRDLFDQTSPDWATTGIVEKVNHLKAFESAGVSVAELLGHYRETYVAQGDPGHVLDSLSTTLQAYRDAGYLPCVPEEHRYGRRRSHRGDDDRRKELR